MIIQREVNTYHNNKIAYDPKCDDLDYINYKALAYCIVGKIRENKVIYPDVEQVLKTLINEDVYNNKKYKRTNMKLYNIINIKTGDIIEKKNSREVFELIDMESPRVSTYCKLGSVYKNTYKIELWGE